MRSVTGYLLLMPGRGDQHRLDEDLAILATGDAALRLRLGQVFEVLAVSSLSAYALERCERSPRSVEDSRCLARRLEALPELRSALASGRLSWSQAELVARVAQPATEASWVAAACEHTERQLRQLVRSFEQRVSEGAIAAARDTEDQEQSEAAEAAAEGGEGGEEERGGTLLHPHQQIDTPCFRSQGGGDEPANAAAVCSWCHLFGIHGGCIRAEGTAEQIRWELGPSGQPCVIVEGRERLAS